jgi:hypothetical protein
MVVTANHYTLRSATFTVSPATTLSVVGSQVRYPAAVTNVDLTYRPTAADGAHLRRSADGSIAAGAARDAYGNCNGTAVTSSSDGADAAADPKVCAQSAVLPRRIGRGGTLPTTGLAWGLGGVGLLLMVTVGVLRRKAA